LSLPFGGSLRGGRGQRLLGRTLGADLVPEDHSATTDGRGHECADDLADDVAGVLRRGLVVGDGLDGVFLLVHGFSFCSGFGLLL
jgi:hypothetical protein